jgi:ribA/ribD-fused uncharacterized protein
MLDNFSISGLHVDQLAKILGEKQDIFMAYTNYILLIGSNDIGSKTVAQITQSICDLVDTLLSWGSTKRIHVLSLLPRVDEDYKDKEVLAVNKALQEKIMQGPHFRGTGRVFWNNIGKKFRGQKQVPLKSLLKPDLIHPSVTKPEHKNLHALVDRVHKGECITGVSILRSKLTTISQSRQPNKVPGIGAPFPEFAELENWLNHLPAMQPAFRHDLTTGGLWLGRIQASKVSRGQGARNVGGQGDILSNFAPCEFYLHGILFTSVEQAYQVSKAIYCYKPALATLLYHTDDPPQLKRLAKNIPSRNRRKLNWDNQVRVPFVSILIEEKFRQVPVFRHELNQTGNKVLVHAVSGRHSQNDFWGTNAIVHGTTFCQGQNKFGILLMTLRNLTKGI